MTTVLLIIQLLVALGLIGVILLQRSEGGALGIGGGGGGGGMMSGRGAANILTRTTMILGAVFIGNSILLAIVTGVAADGTSVFDTEIDNPATGVVEQDELGTPVPTDG
ncbi:preprotein translocase subunit SecG [Maricaulis sp.]|uniref:preprotein translocase subunit SecG n=1 Tax=Maricaulis sp. TaxID=1486257 RepID=UPI002B277A44|nr:preprotein translocase subunit SecG [Maricaulis sp.]